jgi:O-antigen/teichoic acid export membrane protein
MPAAAELDARNDDARTSELYYRAHKYLACIGVALFAVVGLMAHRFVDLWLGPGFSPTARALVVLTGVHIANLAAAPALFILIGRGTLGPAIRFALVGMFGTVLLSSILISLWGFTGTLYGTSVSVLSAASYLIYMFHHETGFSRRRLLRIYVQPVLCGLCVVAVVATLIPVGRFHWTGMAATALAVVVVVSSGSCCYVISTLLTFTSWDAFCPCPKYCAGATTSWAFTRKATTTPAMCSNPTKISSSFRISLRSPICAYGNVNESGTAFPKLNNTQKTPCLPEH